MSENFKPRRGISIIFLSVLAIIVIGALSAGMRFAWVSYYRAAFPLGYKEFVLRYSAEWDLSPELVFAVIRCESGFNHMAYSYAYARGLMQITEDTFEWARWRMGDSENRSFDEMFIPEINIRYGTKILRLLLDQFGGEREALAAYHAGWGSVTRWLEDERFSDDGKTLREIPFRRTNAYVHNVLFTRDVYRSLYDFEGGQLTPSNLRLLLYAWRDILAIPTIPMTRGWM